VDDVSQRRRPHDENRGHAAIAAQRTRGQRASETP
jgi:hypothetical protein